MDKATIKRLLGAYRVGSADRDDPIFADALQEAERDPELAAWLDAERRFDALMIDTLKEAPVPAELRELILLNAKSPRSAATPFEASPRAASSRHLKTWLAAAACVVFAFLLGRQTTTEPTRTVNDRAGFDANGEQRLALQAIAWTGKMPALQFVCFDAAEVARWVAEKSSTLHMGRLLDKPLASMQMIGSSATEWEGKPVIMIALQNKQQMAMLYLVRAADFPGIAGDGQIMEKDGWVSKVGRHGDDLYVLTTKGTRQNLDFPMPL